MLTLTIQLLSEMAVCTFPRNRSRSHPLRSSITASSQIVQFSTVEKKQNCRNFDIGLKVFHIIGVIPIGQNRQLVLRVSYANRDLNEAIAVLLHLVTEQHQAK